MVEKAAALPKPILKKTIRKLQPKKTMRAAITSFKAGTQGRMGKLAEDAYDYGFQDEMEKQAVAPIVAAALPAIGKAVASGAAMELGTKAIKGIGRFARRTINPARRMI